jgi:hypothetical protein
MQCAYCSQQASLRIPSVPDDVCLAHAIEFWAELVAHARKRSAGASDAPAGAARRAVSPGAKSAIGPGVTAEGSVRD